ncbi:hypothetical protein BYT27DRAFT_7123644 [Phlegmacium glaucopus]|nr:hypothetical protein BYT27DRAFT_7123644 [Phlegmacium glaucopus]
MLKPTISRESVTPSISSQTARKNTGIFTRFRSKTPAQPPQYEIWHPNTSSGPNVASSSTMPSSITLPEQKAPAPIPVAVPIAIERISQKSKVFTPFRYLTTKRKRTVSLVSVEAQDGTAPSTVVGSPTASMHSQAPFQPPPVRDAMQATKEWRNKEEAEAHPNGKLRRQRPGVVFDVAEEPPGVDRQRPKRTHPRHKSSSKLS